MDKSTLSNYGWIVIAVLVLAVMIALATPFGSYIKTGVENTTQGLFDTSEKAMNVVGMSAGDGSFESGSDETETPKIEGSATFMAYYDSDYNYIQEQSTLTWDELKLDENGAKYEYMASRITDTSIGKMVFDISVTLKSITIPSTVTKIEEGAFNGCEKLTDVTIPSSVTSIETSAFANCYELSHITFLGTIEQWDKITLSDGWYWYSDIDVICTDGTIGLPLYWV